MNKRRRALLFTSVGIMAIIWGFIAFEKGDNLFHGLDLFVFIAIVAIGILAFVLALRKEKEAKLGLPAEDELSNQIKFKSGYYAYMASMYMWLFIFIFKDKFPTIESMLGGGVLLSALIYAMAKFYVKKEFYEKQD